ncbi:DUF1877 family protein [Clostridium sp. AM58-1XD]|uniref:DUF1877 family protein n=1 Tax=Clostridium sp. AM58-1XD TaxID=2292307 RepID=UPI000E4EA8C0|nr:DUF1877 family protein [Clostridium sp. AM58-1XD]RGZ01609.1 DUF1877 family protein [Clostridium sp. AM58-1XD]
MGCLAVLFALNEQEVDKLKAVKRQERSDYLHEEIEETFFEEYPEYTCELDKSWDAMHRMLTDGNLNFENKYPPLCNVIFGGEFLYGLVRKSSGKVTCPRAEDDEYIILKTPEEVKEIAKVLPYRTKEECRKCYYMIDKEDYGLQTDEEDFEYTWTYLQDSLDFWKKAAEENRYVLFTVDR